MEFWEMYAEQWVIVNSIAVLILWASYQRPRLGRFFFFLLFLWASVTNYITASLRPEVYLDYADLTPIPIFKDFINGWFAQHIWPMVGTIAIMQAIVAFGFLLKGRVFQSLATGAIIFFLAIAPLGIGSGFPSSLTGALAIYFILKRGGRDYIWKRL